MILSPEIEKAALDGRCIWRTFNTGFTESYTIPVPNGSFIILRQIITYPFIQPQKELDPPNSNFIYQLVLAEVGSNNELVYVIRNRFNHDPNPNLPNNRRVPGEPIQIETWAIFKQDLIIDIGMVPAITNSVYDPAGPINNSANERLGGLGYGGQNITPQVDLAGTVNFYPSGPTRSFSDIGVNYAGNITDRLRYKFEPLSNITPPSAGIEEVAAFQVPLITFGYWEFKAGYSNKF